jgi:PAS domain S-box-containing protein
MCIEIFIREVYAMKKTESEFLRNLMKRNSIFRRNFSNFISSKAPKANEDNKDEFLDLAVQKIQNIRDESPFSSSKSLLKCIDDLNSRLDSVSGFVTSSSYSMWRAQESARTNELVAKSFYGGKDQSSDSIAATRRNSAEKALYSLLQDDFEKVMESSSWIPSLITSSENLPISLVFLHGSGDANIIYVNHMFAKLTGYEQEDMKGRDFGILQRAQSSIRIINDVMTSNLRTQELFEVSLEVCRKDESSFKCHFCLKPIHDQNMICQYWIALLQDVSSCAMDNYPLKKLILALPNRVVLGGNFERITG